MIRTPAAIFVLLAATGAASACKCAVVPRLQAIGSAPVVFEGRIVTIETQGTAQVTTLTVVRPVKGGVSSGQTVKVKSRTQSAACGWDFRQSAKTLLVGGEGAGGVVSVRRCTMYSLNP